MSLASPSSSTGALHVILLSAGAAVVALLIAQYFPSIIPARASSVKL
jgi:hypothetical protein